MPNHADCKKLSIYSQLQVRHDGVNLFYCRVNNFRVFLISCFRDC
jgi:hypothetical protein